LLYNYPYLLPAKIHAAKSFTVQECDATMMNIAAEAGTISMKKPASSETGFFYKSA